ncbi:MAG: hypothetical protein RIR49_1756 [Actinomycetota bacterium]
MTADAAAGLGRVTRSGATGWETPLMDPAFTTVLEDDGLTVTGPWRSPRQMLDDQTYDGHASIHDEATAASLGLTGAPIEGPTHFSQFDPIGVHLFGERWFTDGCISAHFETMVVEGEQVRASATRTGATTATGTAVKPGGERVLTCSLSIGPGPTELSGRLATVIERGAGDLVILDRMTVGMSTGPNDATLTADDDNGDLYPFSLAEKLGAITESSEWYLDRSPWGAPIVPTEMLSVMANRAGSGFPVRGPSLGLYVDLEVRRLGAVHVGAPHTVRHEIVALGQSRRTEGYWTRSTISDATGTPVAEVLLHQGVFKESYAAYPADRL